MSSSDPPRFSAARYFEGRRSRRSAAAGAAPQVRTSRFTVTINTNWRPRIRRTMVAAGAAGAFRVESRAEVRNRLDDQLNFVADDLRQAVRRAFTDPDALARMIIRRGTHNRDYIWQRQVQPGQVREIRFIDAEVEIGELTGFVHAHAIIEITHVAQPGVREREQGIHLYRPAIHAALQQYGESEPVQNAPHVKIVGYPSSSDQERYVRKSRRDEQMDRYQREYTDEHDDDVGRVIHVPRLGLL